MLRNRNTNNLLEELEGRQAAIPQARAIGLPASYANFHQNQIRAIKSELARRWRAEAVARNEPRRRARAAKVIQKKFKNIFYTPNNNANGIRGRGYRMTMARVRGNNASKVGPRERLMGTLRTKLNNLRRQTNRGAMVNIYNSMYNKWMEGGGGNGANILNSAQLLMHRRGLIM
jgi:hypothetical protein